MNGKGKYITRENAVELLHIFCDLCDEMKINYSLSGMTIWNAIEHGGFSEGSVGYTCGVMLLFEDYQKIYEECVKRFGRQRNQIYVLDEQNCEEFNEFGFRLMKRSNISLLEGREPDEKYYDFFISIVPIYYAGNTYKEYRKLVRNYEKLTYRMMVKAPLPYSLNIKNAYTYIKRTIYSKKYTPDIFRQLKEMLECHKTETKYVFIPNRYIQENDVRLADRYKNTREIEYDGVPTKIIENPKEWLQSYYGEKQLEKLISSQQNEAQLQGPEILKKVQDIGLELLVEFDRICRKHSINYAISGGTLLGAVRHKGFIPWDDDIDVAMLYDDYLKFEKIAEIELDKTRFFLQNQKSDKDTHLVFPTIRRNGTVYCKPGRSAYDTHRGVVLDIMLFYDDAPTRIQRRIQTAICRFYKTLTWGHMEHAKFKGKIWKVSYEIARKKGGNKYTYAKFLKWADKYNQGPNKKNDRLTYLSVGRNPYNNAFTNRKTYKNLVDIEFEGHIVKTSENYKEVLEFLYGRDYMRYPSLNGRCATHMPGDIELNVH